MDYQEFNKKVLEYYISRSTSSFCNLSMDRTEMERLIPIGQIKLFEELKSCWNNLLYKIENRPQYFGLIAVQCFAASQMHRDEKNAEDAYKIRLKEVLGLSENYNLQILFHGEDSGIAVQEEIWYSAKNYFQKTYGQHLDIPARAKYAGKFVQYPKSQVLLTLQDLKNFTPFFSQEFTVKEAIPYEYFEKRLIYSLNNIQVSQRVQSLFDDDSKIKNCFRRLYDYFNSWEGEVYLHKDLSGYPTQINTNVNLSGLNKILLIFEDNRPAFSLINGNFEIVSVVEVDHNLFGENIQYPYTGLMLFNELEYENEFISSRFLYDNSNNYILLNAQLRSAEFRFLLNNGADKFSVAPDIYLFRYRVDENRKFSPLSKYIQAKNPVSMVGGIKLGRRKDFLVGYGPTILCRLPHIVIHENSRCNYDPAMAEAGIYKIRVDNYKDMEFQLIGKKQLMEPIQSQNIGWNLSTFKIEDAFQVEGCYTACHSRSDLRIWIDLNQRKKKVRYTGTNVLLKAIKQAFI